MSKEGAPQQRRPPRSGYTLAEVVVALSIVTLLMVLVTGSVVFLARSSANLGMYAEMNAESQSALEALGRDARMATEIISLGPEVVIFAFASESGAKSWVRYRYTAEEGVLWRDSATGSRPILRRVERLSFQGTDHLSRPSEDWAQVHAVMLEANLRHTGNAGSPTDFVVSSRFQLRSLWPPEERGKADPDGEGFP